MEKSLFFVLCYSVARACTCSMSHDGFGSCGEFVSDSYRRSLESEIKNDLLVHQIVEKYTKSKSITARSLDTTVVSVRRAVFRDAGRDKDITERCMAILLHNAGRRDVK